MTVFDPRRIRLPAQQTGKACQLVSQALQLLPLLVIVAVPIADFSGSALLAPQDATLLVFGAAGYTAGLLARPWQAALLAAALLLMTASVTSSFASLLTAAAAGSALGMLGRLWVRGRGG